MSDLDQQLPHKNVKSASSDVVAMANALFQLSAGAFLHPVQKENSDYLTLDVLEGRANNKNAVTISPRAVSFRVRDWSREEQAQLLGFSVSRKEPMYLRIAALKISDLSSMERETFIRSLLMESAQAERERLES